MIRGFRAGMAWGDCIAVKGGEVLKNTGEVSIGVFVGAVPGAEPTYTLQAGEERTLAAEEAGMLWIKLGFEPVITVESAD